MKSHRLARVNEVVREVAAEAVLFDLKDPRITGVTVTRAEVEVASVPAEPAVDAHSEPHPDTAIEPNEATVEGAPVELDVTPQAVLDIERAIAQAAPAPQPAAPEPAVLAEPFVAPTPEIDVEAIIAEDPNQIVAPPEKPKRGWWRR